MLFLFYFITQLLFVWRPYEIPTIISCIPQYVKEDRAVCLAVTALMYFEAVEWHLSNCVTRQFGIYQLIPHDLINLRESLNHDLWGKTDWNWIQMYQYWINIWHGWFEHVLHGDLMCYSCEIVIVCRISPTRSTTIWAYTAPSSAFPHVIATLLAVVPYGRPPAACPYGSPKNVRWSWGVPCRYWS